MTNSKSDIGRIIKDAAIELKKYYLEIEDNRLENLTVIKIVQRPFSTIVHLQVQTSTKSKRLVMKTLNHHPINKAIIDRENQALVEYNILKQLYPKFQKVDKCSVPCPILVIPEIETYLMEFVEGGLLIDELRWDRHLSSRKKFMELQDHFYNSGRWLRYFQEFTGIYEASSETLYQVIERAESRLLLIEESGHPSCPKDLLREVKASLYDQLKELSGTKILVSGRHSDFHPLNILGGLNGIIVIDFMGYQKDCVAADGLTMMVHLEDEKRSLTASSHRVEILKEKFLEGYGNTPVVPFPALFICEAMERIISIWGSISTQRRHFYHCLEENIRIKKHINWLTSEKARRLLWPSC